MRDPSLPDGWERTFDQWLEPFLAAFGHKVRRKWAPIYVRGLDAAGPQERGAPWQRGSRPTTWSNSTTLSRRRVGIPTRSRRCFSTRRMRCSEVLTPTSSSTTPRSPRRASTRSASRISTAVSSASRPTASRSSRSPWLAMRSRSLSLCGSSCLRPGAKTARVAGAQRCPMRPCTSRSGRSRSMKFDASARRAFGSRTSLADAGINVGVVRPVPAHALSAMQITWAVGISPDQLVYPITVRLRFPRAATGRPRKHGVPTTSRRSARKAVEALGEKAFRTIRWRRGTKGWLSADFAAVRVRVADGPDAGHSRASARRRGLARLRQLRRKNGDVKFHLTNHCVVASRKTLATAIKARWSCEQAHQRLKGELGNGALRRPQMARSIRSRSDDDRVRLPADDGESAK